MGKAFDPFTGIKKNRDELKSAGGWDRLPRRYSVGRDLRLSMLPAPAGEVAYVSEVVDWLKKRAESAKARSGYAALRDAAGQLGGEGHGPGYAEDATSCTVTDAQGATLRLDSFLVARYGARWALRQVAEWQQGKAEPLPPEERSMPLAPLCADPAGGPAGKAGDVVYADSAATWLRKVADWIEAGDVEREAPETLRTLAGILEGRQ